RTEERLRGIKAGVLRIKAKHNGRCNKTCRGCGSRMDSDGCRNRARLYTRFGENSKVASYPCYQGGACQQASNDQPAPSRVFGWHPFLYQLLPLLLLCLKVFSFVGSLACAHLLVWQSLWLEVGPLP